MIISQSEDTLHAGYAVLWRGVPLEVARQICSDPRTEGPAHFLAWVYDDHLASRPRTREEGKLRWYQVRDDGRYDALLAHYMAELGS